jgi:hypothetical protein
MAFSIYRCSNKRCPVFGREQELKRHDVGTLAKCGRCNQGMKLIRDISEDINTIPAK